MKKKKKKKVENRNIFWLAGATTLKLLLAYP